jgi:hypothetical protein
MSSSPSSDKYQPLNINLIDPNNEILEGTPWYNNEDNLGIPRFENIRSFVQLSMRPKNPNFLEISNNNIVNSSNADDGTKIVLGGYFTDKNKESYYSTNYTDELMGGDNIENKSYEGFGIKNVDITFDPNKIPQVTVVFYDLRGNVVNDFNNKYAKMFQLPYPIFTLEIKGGFGPLVSYKLLKIKDDISIDDLGNYIITSKFIGDRFSPFSDLPLLYLMAVPYLDNVDINIFDTEINSFHELIISSKRLYEKLDNVLNSDQEIANQDEFKALSDELTNYKSKLENIQNKENFVNWFKQDVKVGKKTQDIIINYVNSCTFANNKITFPKPSISFSEQLYNYITNIVKTNVDNLNEGNPLIKIEYKTIATSYNNVAKTPPPPPPPAPPQGYFDKVFQYLDDAADKIVEFFDEDDKVVVKKNIKFISSINYTDLVNKVGDKDKQIIEKGNDFHNDRYVAIANLPNEVLGDTRLTIGTIFSIMMKDYNSLMKKIADAGNKGYQEIIANTRTGQKFDKMGFPTVIDIGAGPNGSNKIIYPGSNKNFKNWPEVKFIEEFLDAYYRALKANIISDALSNKEEDGRSKYIPINPREVYEITDTYEPNKKKIGDNIYFGKSQLEIYKLMYQRFLCFANINADINKSSTVYSTWNSPKTGESDWVDWTKSFLGLTDFNDDKIQQGIFFSTIEMEARNIAYAISLEKKIKDRFTTLSTTFNDSFFSNDKDKKDELTKSLETINNNTLPLLNNLKPFDDDYVTASDLEPKLVIDLSQAGDIISTYMKTLNNAGGGYKITKENVLYIEDNTLNGNNNESDYDFDSLFYEPVYPSLKEQVSKEGNITGLFNFDYGIFKDITEYFKVNSSIFNFIKLYDNAQYPALIEVPRGMLVILGGLLKAHVQEKNIAKTANGTEYYNIQTLGLSNFFDFKTDIFRGYFRIKKDSKFYNYILKEYENFRNIHDFGISYKYTNGSFNFISMIRNSQKTTNDNIIEYIYQKRFISVNDLTFANYNLKLDLLTKPKPPNEVIVNGITNTKDSTSTLYKQYLKVLFKKIAQFVKDDDKKLNDKLASFDSYINDPEVKLAVYKSFQVIYENYLHGLQEKDFTFTVSNNLEESSFAFVDRGYNDISGLNGSSPGCILDIKTLLNDVNDYEVSLFSSMARLLSDNNFWFYPFQSFLTTTKNYNDLFKINFDTPTSGDSKFVAMYVGGLSSNPDGPSTSSLQNDGITKDNIPADLHKKNGVLNAFKVKFTGIQNQMVFSNLQVSTESLKNTDEGLRIQSEIVSNASSSYSIPKGQSLLNVYQKQSYSSTIKIPFGNMGIQPTQYYYQEFMPLFDGLYIVYNVTHSIDADNQRLETTFKGYRLKRDVNPIVEQQFVDYLNKDVYTQGLSDLGVVNPSTSSVVNAGTSTTNSAFNPSDSFWVNARKFVLGNEGFVSRPYWDINNWRIGYGSQVLALNSSLKAVGTDMFNDKHFITLPSNPTKWPQMVDLDTGKITFVTLPQNHVRDYRYFTLKGKENKTNPKKSIPDKYQWDAGLKKPGDKFAGQERNFYSKDLANKAFDYFFNQFVKVARKISPTGFEKLSQKGQIGVTYIPYGFGSFRDFMPRIKAAIALGNDTTLAIAIIEELAIKEGRWVRQPYYRTAKYIEPDILNKVSPSTLAALKNPKYKLDLRG